MSHASASAEQRPAVTSGTRRPQTISRSLVRVVGAAAFSAVIAAASLSVATLARPDVTIDMGRLPGSAVGFYATEHAGDRAFAWTGSRADVSFDGMNRRLSWMCEVEFSGARPAPATSQPEVTFAADDVRVAARAATNAFQRIRFTVVPRPAASGLKLSIISSATFVPGGGDKRVLGVVVDRVSCRPIGEWSARPPLRALRDTAAAAGAFGGAFGLIGGSLGGAVAGAGMLGVLQAAALSAGAAAYGPYSGTLLALAAWIASVLVVGVKLLEVGARRPLRSTAAFALGFSAAAAYVRLVGLMHPEKGLVDAVFHAHRLEWVLAGRFYFTQLSTSATPFPYAIGLYLFAAPWTLLTHDHVALLRVVVCASDAIAGALLYLAVARAWGDRLTAAIATVLFALVPVSFAVVGNANLTNAFGQSVGVVTVACVVAWSFGRHRAVQVAGLVLLATLGFISHVSTLTLLATTLVAAGVFYAGFGTPGTRSAGRCVLVATAVALALSMGLYWGHFGSVYRTQLARLRGPAVVNTGAVPAPGQPGRQPPAATQARTTGDRPQLGRTTLPLTRRAGDAVAQTLTNFGWPIVLLALVGAWRLSVDGVRDRLGLVLAAWGAVWLTFVGFSVLSPGDVRFQQDAWEFIGRVEHATCAGAAILAARGVTWAWRAGAAPRVAALSLLAAAALLGVRAWSGWL